uniref:WAT1-related protein n=1 Tax=Fagus sylvatica TaxID=28930 RepID=A0A2N9FGF6_FAGSY
MGGLDEYKPAMAMLGLQFSYAAVVVFTRAALVQGMSPRVFVVYRQAIATLVISPIAYFSRLEKVNFGSLRSIAKILGTILCVTGAMFMALLRGPKLLNVEFLPTKSVFGFGGENWLLGCLFLFGSCCCWSLWLILQGCIGSGLAFFVQAWCISQRGPLFSAMFNPMCTIIVTIMAAVFLHEEIYTGSLIGAIGVIIGLYAVLWGKAKNIVEINENTKIQTDEAGNVNILKVDSSENTSCRIDLEEPLLADKASNVDESGICH